jgi:hypothetical protein
MSNPSPTPSTPNTTFTVTTPQPAVKIASPDLILIKQEDTPVETMTDMVFQDIGGQEIISVARNDLVNGINVRYQPITNIKDLFASYNSSNLIKLPNSSDSFFRNFTISLETHTPNVIFANAQDEASNIYVYSENESLGPGYKKTKDVTSVTVSSGVATVTVSEPHLYLEGQYVALSGFVSPDDDYNSKPRPILSINSPYQFTIDTVAVGNAGNGSAVVGYSDAQHINNVYMEQESGDIVIDLKNIMPGEQVEVQIISPESLLDDTIYTVGVNS